MQGNSSDIKNAPFTLYLLCMYDANLLLQGKVHVEHTTE